MNNEFGCTPCFCFGHSALCATATGYSRTSHETLFVRGTDKWSANVAGNSVPVQYDSIAQAITVTAPDRDNVYFLAPGLLK